jgi:hypothetical protein
MLHNFTKFETLFKLVQLGNFFFFEKMKKGDHEKSQNQFVHCVSFTKKKIILRETF